MAYADDVQTTCTPQTEAVRGKGQVQNNAGGYVFKVDHWSRLERFLILGHEGGTFYAGQRKLSIETVACIDECLAADGLHTVDIIVGVSVNNRAPKVDPVLFALAYVVAKTTDDATRSRAYSAIKKVCRTATHLFDFLNNCKTLGKGWGTGFRNTIASWYDREPQKLAMQVTKYAQRNGWSHRDVLRKCHATSSDHAINDVLKYVTQREEWSKTESYIGPSNTFLCAVESMKNCNDVDSLVMGVKTFGLVREHIPTKMLNEPRVWEALLEAMPPTAMIRNLGKMASVGLTVPLSNASTHICNTLADPEKLKAQRVHPLTLLVARQVYKTGKGVKGNLTWSPDQNILAALEKAFYSAFDLVEPTCKRFMLGVDVSSSMSCGRCAGSEHLTPCQGAAVMAMLAKRTEQNSYIYGFARRIRDLGITANDTLDNVCRKAQDMNFGSTDCSALIEHASRENIDTDVFCIYTDNETYGGTSHVYQALDRYRQKVGHAVKLAVFGMESNGFSIADPTDADQMDFVGFDTAVPQILAEFVTR